jgi:hypothetical protein
MGHLFSLPVSLVKLKNALGKLLLLTKLSYDVTISVSSTMEGGYDVYRTWGK